METTYYNLNARKVKVSGGADMTTFVPVAVPAPAPRQQSTGEVLDFARCRQRLETKAAWRELAQTARELPRESEPAQEPAEEVSPAAPVSSRRERVAGWLELCASASIIAMCLAAVCAFLRLM